MSNQINNFLKIGFDHFNKNELNEAKSAFIKVIDLDKKNFQGLHSIGVIYAIQKNYEDAKNYFLKCLNIKPNDLSANQNLANSLLELGLFENALDRYEFCIRINPKLSKLWCFKGIALKELKRQDEAIVSLEQSIKLDNNFEIPYFHLGSIYKSLKLFEKSIEIYESALSIFNDKEILEVIYTNLSGTYLNMKNNVFGEDYSRVRETANKALSINPKNYIALNNLAMSYLFELKHKETENLLNEVIKIKPNFAEAYKNLGSLYAHLGNHAKSEEHLKFNLALEPNDKSKNLLLAECLLFQNKFQEAWHYYEDRWDDESAADKTKPNFKKPLWKPVFGYDCEILIWAEQGIGDMVLFSSILPDVVKKFKNVYLAIDGRLCKVIKNSIPGINVINFSNSFTENFFDYQLPLGSLGKYFRNNESDFLTQKPIFSIQENDFPHKKRKYRCGISWKSKGGLKSDKKNISLNFFNEFLKLNQIEFYDIQYTNDEDESITFNKKSLTKFKKPENLDIFNDIYGLLKFMDTCDFIISTSNTNAHLAGALGKPLFLLLPKEYGRLWYWDNDFNGKNLWYPCIKKFSQKIQGEWDEPINDLLEEIKKNYI